MTADVTIERLRTTVHAGADGAPAVRRVESLLRAVTDTRLHGELSHLNLPAGHLCLEHLDVTLPLAADDHDDQVAEDWARIVAASMAAALGPVRCDPSSSPQGPGVAWYPHQLGALIDALCGMATGGLGRRWAWVQLGVCSLGDPHPGADPAGAVTAALRRSPELAAAALIQVLTRCGIEVLNRALGRRGWAAAAAVVAPDLGWSETPNPGTADASTDDARDEVAAVIAATVDERALRMAQRSAVGRLAIGSGFRLSPAAASGLATLAIAETEPALFSRPRSVILRDRVAILLAGVVQWRRGRSLVWRPTERSEPLGEGPEPADGATPDSPVAADPGNDQPPLGLTRLEDAWTTPSRSVLPESSNRPAGGQPGERPGANRASDPRPGGARPGADPGLVGDEFAQIRAVPRLPHAGADPRVDLEASRRPRAAVTTQLDPATVPPVAADRPAPSGRAWSLAGRRTRWAGLPFLLALAGDLGLPDRVVQHPVLGRRPLPLVLRQVAVQLVDTSRDDAAVLAFAGLADPGPPDEAALDPAETAAVSGLARDWVEALDSRLRHSSVAHAQADGPLEGSEDQLGRVAGRDGVVRAEPGWIDIELDPDQVDLDVRRAGLDLDPGWVPWLGVVLRYRYV